MSANRPAPVWHPPQSTPTCFSGQVEGHGAVVKFVAISVNAIMTAQAVVRVDQEVDCNKISIDLLVTGSADGLVELAVAIYVTGVTGKRGTIRLVGWAVSAYPKESCEIFILVMFGQGNCRPTVIRVTVRQVKLGLYFSKFPCSVDRSFCCTATSVWQTITLIGHAAVCQKAAWQPEQLPPRPACEVTPPNVAPVLEFSAPGLKKYVAAHQPTTTTIRAVKKAEIRPKAVRQPKGFLFMTSTIV